MGWLYNLNYFGPDRRSNRFEVRFVERRRKDLTGTRETLRGQLRQLASRGMRWVDHLNYFGPDRRADVFSYFFFERRRQKSGGPPPPLHAALRQLRVRVLDISNAEARLALRERVIATALLADAQGRSAIGDLLTRIASDLEKDDVNSDLAAAIQAELIRAEALLGA